MNNNFNFNKQHTLKSVVAFSGKGVHTGGKATVKLVPAEPNFGIQFQRIDLPNQPLIKADCDLVSDTSRSTTLQIGDAKVSTIEHLLAALVGVGVDNIRIEIDNVEVPIMDGSAQPFIALMEEAGIVEQDATKIWYTIDENIYYEDVTKSVEMIAMPTAEYMITTMIDFDSKVLGKQYADLKHIRDFATEIAPCRTFCFLHELEVLVAHNLVQGGDIDNAIVIVDKPISDTSKARLEQVFNRTNIEVKQGYLNNLELRFINEPARHKTLDVVGDLALIGYPIKARIVANRPGHSTNVAFAKKIKQYLKQNKIAKVDVPCYNPNTPPLLDSTQIANILPHRYPFLLVDKIISMTANEIVGVKNITLNEPYFTGHFPGNPIMPGVLQIEALAQAGGILCIKSMPEGKKYDTYFLKIENCKFKQKVVPGDTLLLKLTFNAPIRRGICNMHGTVYVGDKMVSEVDLVALVTPQEESKK